MSQNPKEVLELVKQIGKGKNNPILDGYKFKSGVKYVAGLATALTSGKLILASQTEDVGVTNIQQAKLQNPFVVTGLRFVFDTDTGAGVTAKTAVLDDAAPAAFANGELVIRQGDDLIDIPVGPLCNLGGTPASIEDSIFQIAPFIIREKIDFEANIDLAGTATANHVYRFEIFGYELVPDKTIM